MGRRWTAEDIANLKKLAQQHPLPLIVEKMYRSVGDRSPRAAAPVRVRASLAAEYPPGALRIQGRRQREPGCDQQGRAAIGDSRWPKINVVPN
jgi:hypothetical protein